MRYWTIEEAREYLPRLRSLLVAVQTAAPAARAPTNGHGPVTEADLSEAVADARSALEELQAGDIVLRDLASGLIDFHAQGADGEVYLLCWLMGEDELEWWHGVDEGFPGRKRLPRDT